MLFFFTGVLRTYIHNPFPPAFLLSLICCRKLTCRSYIIRRIYGVLSITFQKGLYRQFFSLFYVGIFSTTNLVVLISQKRTVG